MGILQEGIISDGLFMSYFSYVIDFLLSFFTTRIYCAKICFSFAFSKCLLNFFAFNFCFIVLFRFLWHTSIHGVSLETVLCPSLDVSVMYSM